MKRSSIPRAAALCLLSLLVLIASIPQSLAQAGNNNPTGPTGQFNGSVTSAGSYDPYTGNSTRSLSELAIAGAVSEYGLSYTRTWNSRWGNTWRHSFEWSVADVYDLPAGQPVPYTVSFPDGREETFGPPHLGGAWRAGTGTRERFKPIGAGGLCYLLLPDGGKVEFSSTSTSWVDYEVFPYVTYYSYSFKTEAIIDPYGQRITYSYNPDGTLYRVTEPAGRYLQFNYSGGRLASVTGSDGRSVVYTYTTAPVPGATVAYTLLTSVRYFGDPTLDATYTYEKPNVGSVDGAPLLKTCSDTMYAGPMKNISYVYATADNPNGTPPVFGQILSENHLTTGQPVSTLTMNTAGTRTELRGDGASRTFTYDVYTGLLVSATDFKGVGETRAYDANRYINAITDRRGSTTNFTNNAFTGGVTQTTFPLTGFDGGVRSTVQTVYGYAGCPDPNNQDANNPYYPCSVTNERGHWTTFWRDMNKRIIKIDHPNGSWEAFTYNRFGQVLTHRQTNGGIATSTYDDAPGNPNATARRLTHKDAVWTTGNPTFRYQYDGRGRLSGITDARAVYDGGWYYTTEFEYNERGQVTKVTHPIDVNSGPSLTRFFVTSAYNRDGTLASTTNELNHTTTYGYDDYKRVTSVTNALNQVTWSSYKRWNQPAYSHTASFIYYAGTPAGRQVHFDSDENFRRLVMREPTAEVDAWTFYGYDPEGNLTWTQDPRGNATTFAYDERGRRYATYAPLGQTMLWEYDRAGNLTKETRPDNLFRTQQFDSMNRLTQTFGFANEGTGYAYDLAGNLTSMTDAKGAVYSFAYDALNRKTSATYPPDIGNQNRTETWRYDTVGNMDQYKNPAGQIKTITYDNRNRPTNSSWSGGSGPTVTTAYDAASRITQIARNNNETVVAFGYDNANRQISETQSLAGFPDRVVTTPVDADAERSSLSVVIPNVGTYRLNYAYTGRGQLKTISGANFAPIFQYTYDPNGNLLKRQGVSGGINDSLNVTTPAGANGYDALNRPTVWENTGAADAAFARSLMEYDSLSRLTATWRNEQADQGERFGYSADGQLISAVYNATQPWTSNPQPAPPPNNPPYRTVSYNTDVLNRTGADGVNENGMQTAFAYNPMNQYTVFGTQTPNYTANFNLFWMNGFEYNYDAENRLTSVTNRAQFVYDGLGRCVKRTIDGVTTLLTYDGWKPIVEWDGSGNFVAWNIYGSGPDEILWRYQAGVGHLRYHHDRLGNVVFLLDYWGNGIEKYSYDAFGQPRVTDWNGANPRTWSNYGNRFMFTGREYLAELGIYDYRNRMYQPQLGRFLQPDPIGFAAGDANLFRYCGGDPVNKTDPMGLAASGGGQEQNRPEVPRKKDGPSVTTTTGRTPTGSHIPEMRTATPMSDRTWDITYRDSINGTNFIGSFALVSGGGFSGADGGASFVPAVSISARTVIEEGIQQSTKTIQSLILTREGAIEFQSKFTGGTAFGPGTVPGLFRPNASGSGTTVTMSGKAYATPILLAGAAGGVGGLAVASDYSIDYRLTIAVDFSRRYASITGSHDGFPSYYVTVGNTELYRFHQQSFGDLRSPMEINVNDGGYW